jgi:hypothetical protein
MTHNRTHSPLHTIALGLLLPVFASISVASAQQLSPLNEHYVLDPIRVFYTNEGQSAVSQDDVDQSGVPDQVENVAKQVWAARKLFCDVLEFPDPFESERFKGVTCIQVFLRDRAEINGVNGVAFSAAQRARSIPEGKPDDRALVMAVSIQLDPIKNVSPAHETFHLVQYGATYFKRSWYLEGQARWAEHALAEDGIGEIKFSPRGPWPQRPQQLQQLPELGSKSEWVLWNPIAARTDKSGVLSERKLGEELVGLRYSDGSPVLRDHSLYGPEVMRDILIELGKQDDEAFKDLGYDKWSGENQGSDKNDPYIYRAIMDVLRRHAPPVGPYDVPPPKG